MENKTKYRIVYLYQLLVENSDESHPLSTVEIIDLLKTKYDIDVNRNTLGKDLEVMKQGGLPIEIIHSTQNKYYYDGQLFDLAELKVLIDAVLSSKFITEKKSQELIKRLLALTSEQNADQLRRHIDVSDRVKSENEKGYYILDAINSAIDSKKKISFQYVDYDVNKQAFLKHDGKAYIVSPYELVWDGDFYYVIGYNDARQKVQNFRLDRIFKCPEILEDTSVPIPSDVNLILYRKSVFQMFGAEGITEVELLCHQIVMKALIDVFGQSIDTRAIDAEYFIVSIKACVSPTFLRWVFGWNGLVKIISPKEVSERYCLMLKTTLESQQSVMIGEQNDLL
jgi:predicted DNA-binding transcriptional regulator YafY